ncbi:MAG: pabC [Nevskia sp.]|nr:pabC [Nevskia sp.]
MSGPAVALFNGAPLTADWALSRGLHYGDGVFRTVLRHRARWIDWSAQLAKLSDDAARIDLRAPDAATLTAEADALAGDQADAVLKILLWRAGAGRGYRSDASSAERLLLRYPVPQFPAAHWTQGIRAFRSRVTLSAQPRLAGIKHLNRLEQVLASRDWPNDAQEGILLSAAGGPVCGTRSNLFWAKHGRLFTPDLRDSGVAGMMRGRVLALAQQMEIQIETGSYPLQALLDADEAFVTNSLIGLWPLQSFETRVWAVPGATTRRLSAALAHPLIAAP